MAEVRRIRPGEGPALRRIRLAALSDSPGAFSETYDAAAARDADHWAAMAESHSHGSLQATFVVEADGTWLGMAGGYRHTASEPTINLVAMWVAPDSRSNGFGGDLVAAIVDWAVEVGAGQVDLWVTIGNEPARRLYESYGFVEVGDYQPLPSDPCKNETRMRLELARRRASA